MTNPNNAVGTNAAFSGRTSPNALNDGLAGFSKGVVSGWACVPSSGLTVALGGNGTTRDVAIAEDNSGNKLTINNISGSPINVTIGAAPASNSRIDLIVAYVDNPPQGSSTITDNYGACGLIVVAGTAASTPVAPNDTAIRSAITADGASGITAYYVVLTQITIASGTTDITNNEIDAGDIGDVNIRNKQIVASKIDTTTLPGYTFAQQSFSKTKSVGSTWSDFDSYTIVNSGLYIVEIDFQGGATSTQYRSSARITRNGTFILGCGEYSSEAWSGNQFTEGETTMAFWLNTGDVIKSQGRNENWTGNLTIGMKIQQIY